MTDQERSGRDAALKQFTAGPTMPLRSMTGFARADGADARVAWFWEVRSVNGRGLDVRLRLPPGLDGLDAKVREAVAGRIGRGNVALTLSLSGDVAPAGVRLNEGLFADVIAAARRAEALSGAAPATLDGLLALRGVLETVEAAGDPAALEARNAALLSSLEAALSGLRIAREKEGARLAAVLETALADIARLTANAAASPERDAGAIARRIGEAVRRVVKDAPELNSDRLHQEAMLIATRADIEEEVKRLEAHVAAARELLAGAEPAGRKLDFLTQELNREANTLCSKANGTETARIGLELKAVIDQMREQVQNIE